MDKLTPARRSANMRAIRSKDTKPEMLVRRAVHALGFRYRLHRRDLPGRPDLAFIGRRKAIFVHGCFWHHHEGCRRSAFPTTRAEFWRQKIEKNSKRDADVIMKIAALGWTPVVVWECQTKRLEELTALLEKEMSA